MDTTVNEENDRNNAGHRDKPVNHVFDQVIRFDAVTISTIFESSTNKDRADGAHDKIGRHHDSETDKSLSESFLAFGGFAGVASGEDIEVATVNNIAKDEVGGNDSYISCNIRSDHPNATFKGFFVSYINVTIPRCKTEKRSIAIIGISFFRRYDSSS